MSVSRSATGTQGDPAGEVWSVLRLLRWTTDHFAARGIESPRLDAELLLAHALGVERLRLYLDFDKPVVEAERARFRELVQRRAQQRVPVAQLVGRKEFWSRSLRITPDVLIPRPDTEILVQAALELLPADAAGARGLEIGVGSGAVAIALALERPGSRWVATDLSRAALEVAAQNAADCGVAERIELRAGDLFAPVVGERFDLLVSNPPYVGEAERSGLAPELAHEPELALFAGPAGLDLLERLVAGAAEQLAPGAGLALEMAPAQLPGIASALRAAGFAEVREHRDLAGRPRVLTARRG